MPEPLNAEPPSEFTLAGISIVFKLVVFWKVVSPISVNPAGSLTSLKLEQPWNKLFGNCVTWVADKSMVVREVQPLKIEVVGLLLPVVPKLVKLFGTFTSVKLKQPWKAWFSILVTLLEANVTLVRETMFWKAPWLVLVGS